MSAASSHVDTVRGVAGSAVRRVLGERVEKVGLYRRELLKGRAFWGNVSLEPWWGQRAL